MSPRASRRDEMVLAIRIKKLTHKKLSTCVFCLRKTNYNFHNALRYCGYSAPTTEGDRIKVAT